MGASYSRWSTSSSSSPSPSPSVEKTEASDDDAMGGNSLRSRFKRSLKRRQQRRSLAPEESSSSTSNLEENLQLNAKPSDEEEESEDTLVPAPELSEESKKLVRESWIHLQSNLESVGVAAFLRIFETHPDTLATFMPTMFVLDRPEMDEWYREKLRVHSLRVMSVVEKTVHRLDRPDKLGVILEGYGRRHQGYGVRCDMLDAMSGSFLAAIQPHLEEMPMFSEQLLHAWRDMFDLITHYMKQGFSHEDLQH